MQRRGTFVLVRGTAAAAEVLMRRIFGDLIELSKMEEYSRDGNNINEPM
jgi:hypothetical protein